MLAVPWLGTFSCVAHFLTSFKPSLKCHRLFSDATLINLSKVASFLLSSFQYRVERNEINDSMRRRGKTSPECRVFYKTTNSYSPKSQCH